MNPTPHDHPYHNLLHRLDLAMLGSCTCVTKTPDFTFHDEQCRYRVLSEASALIQWIPSMQDTSYRQGWVDMESAAANAEAQLADEWKAKAEAYDAMLRDFAFHYSAGGYNSDGLIDPEVARDKLEWIVKDAITHAKAELSLTLHQPQDNTHQADLTRKWKFREGCDCGCNTPCFTEPFEALRFLMRRMNGAGVAQAVGESYAHDIYQILKRHHQLDDSAPSPAPYGWLTGDGSSHGRGNLEDVASSLTFAQELCDQNNAAERKLQQDPAYLDPDWEPRVPIPVYLAPVAPAVSHQPDWLTAERICDEDHVDEALRAFTEDATGDNATGLILAALTVYAADVQALQQHPAENNQPLDRDRIRAIFMANGFTIKDGQTDLKDYVYAAADDLLRAACQPVKDHVVREVVNSLRDTAIEFHHAQQLRERLRGCITPLLTARPAPPELAADTVHSLWHMAWDVAIKEGGVFIGNADVAHMNQPVVFARLLSDAAAICTAEQRAEELRQRNEAGLRSMLTEKQGGAA